jgi:hypothetical protein
VAGRFGAVALVVVLLTFPAVIDRLVTPVVDALLRLALT